MLFINQPRKRYNLKEKREYNDVRFHLVAAAHNNYVFPYSYSNNNKTKKKSFLSIT